MPFRSTNRSTVGWTVAVRAARGDWEIALATSGELPQRDHQPAYVGTGDQPDLLAVQRQHGALCVSQHDSPRPNQERGTGASGPINTGNIGRTPDVANTAV